MLVPALNPDVALIHVQRCDAYGNAQMDGLQFMDIDLAMAANRVILTTERIVSNDQIRRAPDQTKNSIFLRRRGGRGALRRGAARMLRRLRADDAALEAYVTQVNAEPVKGMRNISSASSTGPGLDRLSVLIGMDELLEAAQQGAEHLQ